jgi:hypothetical protein
VQDTSQIFAPLAAELRPHTVCLVPPRTPLQKFAFLREYDFALIAAIGLVLLLFFLSGLSVTFSTCPLAPIWQTIKTNRRKIVNQRSRTCTAQYLSSGAPALPFAGVPS